MMTAKETERLLVERAQAGDTVAFEQLYRAHTEALQVSIRRWVSRSSLRNKYDVIRDVEQETWVRVFEKLHGFRGDASLETWVHKIALNRFRVVLKGAGKSVPISEEACSHNQAPPDSQAESREALEILLGAINSISNHRHRSAYVHYLLEYEYREIAWILELPEGTVGSDISRARSHVKTWLSRRLGVSEKEAQDHIIEALRGSPNLGALLDWARFNDLKDPSVASGETP